MRWINRTKPSNARGRRTREGGKHPAAALFIVTIGLLLVLGLATTPLNAQVTGSATLRGSVRDENGAVVTKSSVTLINEATRDERKTTTNNEGLYVFSSVHPGAYT